MITIVFESHSTSVDNEQDIASGLNDMPLSNLGLKQAKDLGERYQDQVFDAVFCSNQQRSYRTAEIAFGNRDFPIIRDPRLRECDYAHLNGAPKAQVDAVKGQHIHEPFPGGESYEQTTEKMQSFLNELAQNYNGKKVMIIGSRATQYGLEHLINQVPLAEAVTAPWGWQPGWIYYLNRDEE